METPDGMYDLLGYRFKHLKRGTFYKVIGVTSLQASSIPEIEGLAVVIYESDDEDRFIFVRPWKEFIDGRFERV